MNGQRVYIVGKVLNFEANAWEFIGVFTDVTAAVGKCLDETYFVGPTTMNECHQDSIVWPLSWYPLTQTPPPGAIVKEHVVTIPLKLEWGEAPDPN